MDLKLEGIRARISSILLITTSLAIYSATVTEPVNAPKLLVLAPLTLSLLAFFRFADLKTLFRTNLLVTILVTLFSVSSISSLIFTNTSFAESFFGVFGRNTGFLTYTLLTLLFLTGASFTKFESLKSLVDGFAFVALANLIYSLFQAFNLDFMPWKATFTTPVLGTFGNPNFIGAFMGITVAFFFALSVQDHISRRRRYISIALGICALFVIDKSNAVQGFVVAFAGLVWVVFLWLNSHTKNRLISLTYICCVGVLGVLGVLGVGNVGPLAQFLYKPSVTFRGEYWIAGFQMGFHNLLNGVGWDSYGTFYRQYRAESALVTPGLNTVSNAAHNVYVDIFASGGLPLIMAYLFITISIAVLILRTAIKRKTFDFIFVSLSTVWIGYQLQSLVSINQIGLAIWGWSFGGALIAYERLQTKTNQDSYWIFQSRRNHSKKVASRNLQSQSIAKQIAFGSSLAIVGIIIASPPFTIDSKWRAALVSRDAVKIEAAVHAWPPIQGNYIVAATLFTNNNLQEKGFKFIEEASRIFPNSYDIYSTILNMPQATIENKKFALSRMKVLDPFNHELQKIEIK